MNHLERLRPNFDSSSDSCQEEEKAKDNKTCDESLERVTGLMRYCAAGTASCIHTVPSSTGAGHSGSRVEMLATTQTSV
jgi:hypothetical protein